MKKAQREPYLALTRIRFDGGRVLLSLCGFCRFAKRYGSCEESYAECTHPLPYVQDWLAERVMEGEGVDCWAFRPEYDIEMAADIAGVYLQGADRWEPAGATP